jgi:hypothetical protein
MTTPTAEISVDLPCHHCGYDLRAHPRDGVCPECGASIAESVRLAAIPRRPAWRDSEPRWRRRMLAGIWILVLLPLMDVLQGFNWTASIPVPTILDYRGALTLNETFLGASQLYQPLVFCIGVVLLFSKERGRRPSSLDWTRRWGIISSYITLLLTAAEMLLTSALVLGGIAALFLDMPPKYQPRVTQLFVDISTNFLRYGPQSSWASGMVHVAFSSIAMLLACVPLFNALRSSGPKRLAAMLLAPLAAFALMHLGQVGMHFAIPSVVTADDVWRYRTYFAPAILVTGMTQLPTYLNAWASLSAEALKWCLVLTIAIQLTIAQRIAHRPKNKTE